jgi:hypothetical protein
MRDEAAREGTWAIATSPERPSCIAVWPRPVDSLDCSVLANCATATLRTRDSSGRARPGRKTTVLIAQDDDDPVRRSRPPGGARHRAPAGPPPRGRRTPRTPSRRRPTWPGRDASPNLAAAHAWADTEQPAITRITPPPGEPAGTDLDRPPGAPQPSTAEVRAWARRDGLTVPDRGLPVLAI